MSLLKDFSPADLPFVRAKLSERSLIDFMRFTWSAVEPTRPFVRGWVLDAICEHLEAVADGDIKRLIINVPPGFAKSLTTNVFFPAWLWGPRRQPSLRFMSVSYSSQLTERDNLRLCQLVGSPVFKQHWGDVFTANESMVKVTNDKTGWKLATSVGGVGTGERADFLLCLPYSGLIFTDAGFLPIGLIVEERLPVRVAGWDGSRIRFQRIDAYERNPGRGLVDIDFGDGVLRCTEDHLVWTEGRGWIEAGKIESGEVLLALQPSVCGEKVPCGAQDVLQQSLLDGDKLLSGGRLDVRHARCARKCSTVTQVRSGGRRISIAARPARIRAKGLAVLGLSRL